MNGLSKNYWISLTGLFLLMLLSGCSLIRRQPLVSAPSSANYIHNLRVLIDDTVLESEASVTINSPDLKGQATALFTWNAPDSLTILVRDPLGRKSVLLNLYGDDYMLRMLRQRQKFSGRDWPENYHDLPLSRLTVPELRGLVLGLPPCGEFRAGANCLTAGQADVRVVFDPVAMVPDSMIFRSDNGQQLIIIYEKFAAVSGCALPQKIAVSSNGEQFSLDIHFTSHKIRKKSNK